MKKVMCVVVGLSFLVVGCATEYVRPSQQTVVLSSGDFVEYVSVDAKDHTGANSRVVDRFYKNPKTGELVLFTKSDFGGQGIMNGFMQGGFAGLAQGAGFATGMALLRPSSTNVNNNNAGSGDGSAVGDGATGGGNSGLGSGAGGLTVNNNANAAANQVQGQAQGQIQGQVQGQTQTLRNTNTNINRNTNINTLKNTNTNVNTNVNTLLNNNKTKFNPGKSGNPPYGNAWGHGHGSGKPDKN